MKKEELRKMLDTTYELEGLIELALRRGSNAPQTIFRLIAEKSYTLANIAATNPDDMESEIDSETIEYIDSVQSASEENTSDKPTAESDYTDNDSPTIDSTDDDENDNDKDDAIELFTSQVIPAIVDENNNENSEQSDSDEDSCNSESEIEDEISADYDDEDNNYNDDVEDDNDEPEGENEYIEEPVTHPYYSTSNRKNIRSCFTINDNFRFRRELFSNNNREYNDSLNLLETMESIEEAEDYFYNDLQWDAESEDVKEFMNIISRYFSQS